MAVPPRPRYWPRLNAEDCMDVGIILLIVIVGNTLLIRAWSTFPRPDVFESTLVFIVFMVVIAFLGRRRASKWREKSE